MAAPKHQIMYAPVGWGADPEFFFTKNKKVTGSERIIPEKGWVGTSGKIVRDGIQAEFNPTNVPGCRANFGNNMMALWRDLQRHIDGKGVEVSLGPLFTVPQKELDALSVKSKILGCEPSLNLYNPDAVPGVDGEKYRKRSAGGHIHLGLTGWTNYANYHERIIAMMDALLGNTCVLIDRDKANKERRKVYGRAGEYRKPKHGVEYRTLSNFWLKAYPLLSMVLGISRLAVSIVYTSGYRPLVYDPSTGQYKTTDVKPKWDAEGELFGSLKQANIIKAINSNNYDLAFKNWKVVRDFINEYQRDNFSTSLGANQMKLFDHFLSVIADEGLDYWFKKDPMAAWTTCGEGHDAGFETFLAREVSEDLKSREKLIKKEA